MNTLYRLVTTTKKGFKISTQAYNQADAIARKNELAAVGIKVMIKPEAEVLA